MIPGEQNKQPVLSGVDQETDINNAASTEPSSTTAHSATRETPLQNRLQIRLLTGLAVLAVIYTLALAQSFLVPIAMAFLLSLLLAPAVRGLERLHVPRTLGAGVIIVLLLTAIGYGVSSSLDPINTWFDEAPLVLKKLERKINPIKQTVEEVNKAAEQVDRLASVSANETVEIKGISIRDVLYANARGLVTGTVMTILLLYFILSWGWVIMARIGRLLGERKERHRFLELSIILESEISRYLAYITIINLGLGVVVAAALYALNMPNPLLWGTVAALLNYIPYLGGLVTAGLLGVTALLASDGLSLPSLVVGIFLLLTIIEGQIVTPLVVGKQLTLNPLVVFLSVVFWFWLWGVVGAFIAVPLLITLKLVSERVELMRSIAVITGR